jgi:hypothetical protein
MVNSTPDIITRYFAAQVARDFDALRKTRPPSGALSENEGVARRAGADT